MIEKIYHKHTLIAIRYKKFKNDATPLTDPSEPLQVVAFKVRKGKYTKAHIHTPRKRTTQKLQECLVVVSGKIKIDLYTSGKIYFKSIYLSSGQAVVLVSGGHAVHVLQDSEIFEIKNGPYLDDKVLIE